MPKAVFLIKVIGIHTKVLYTHEELDEIEKIEKSLSTYLIFSQQKKWLVLDQRQMDIKFWQNMSYKCQLLHSENTVKAP